MANRQVTFHVLDDCDEFSDFMAHVMDPLSDETVTYPDGEEVQVLTVDLVDPEQIEAFEALKKTGAIKVVRDVEVD